MRENLRDSRYRALSLNRIANNRDRSIKRYLKNNKIRS